ncbi:hypothetical protein ACROYT_G024811 [Oculina patagonica]
MVTTSESKRYAFVGRISRRIPLQTRCEFSTCIEAASFSTATPLQELNIQISLVPELQNKRCSKLNRRFDS